MAVFSEYQNYDGLGLAELVRRKEVSVDDIIDTVFHLIDALNPQLNAIVRPMRDEAERDASAGLADSAFTGVPIVLKDEYLSYANVPNDHSSRLGSGITRPYDTYLVEAYRKAGILIVAKSNLPELGAAATTDATLYGPCSTPWDPSRNSGGSSGGSASAVAAGIVPIGYANDGAGSIRIPASCCGAFGLKPTRARVSTGPDGGEYWNGLVIEHAITRSVRDSAALLDATDGQRPGDYYCAPPKARPFLDEVGADPGRLRIGFSAATPFGTEVSPDCIAAMEETAKLCESLGHHVEEAAPDFDGPAVADGITKLLCIHLAYGIDELAEMTGRTPGPDNVEAATLELARRGREIPATEFLGVLELFTATARRVVPFWQEYDLLLTPTLGSPPVPHGYIYTNDPDADRYVRRKLEFVPYTPLANIVGSPAMTVPLFWNTQELPVGSHFIGRFGDEATLFRLAAQLEEAQPWSRRHPPVSAWRL
ncbi:MAG: amidase [Sphingomonadales bacterium]|nr:amidase [Sphingomonadales bacterium]